ncbi:hypothetical protein CDL15_Pgr026750 [Punica granatum]|uniref:Ribosomal RNA-processing protein 14 N-terminal domain-containing protein n=1 Tax=Punica granatum TaxID=22663 RepID=A0A218WN42_PUNGR|nr:hypothetical protein CDL15_Pgr026750 [Punica granatum]
MLEAGTLKLDSHLATFSWVGILNWVGILKLLYGVPSKGQEIEARTDDKANNSSSPTEDPLIPAKFYLPNDGKERLWFHGSKAQKESVKKESRKKVKKARRDRLDSEKSSATTVDLLMQSLEKEKVDDRSDKEDEVDTKLTEVKKYPVKGEMVSKKHSRKAATSRAAGIKARNDPKLLKQSIQKEKKRH